MRRAWPLLKARHTDRVFDKGEGAVLELVEQLPRVGRFDLQLAVFDVEAVVRAVVSHSSVIRPPACERACRARRAIATGWFSEQSFGKSSPKVAHRPRADRSGLSNDAKFWRVVFSGLRFNRGNNVD